MNDEVLEKILRPKKKPTKRIVLQSDSEDEIEDSSESNQRPAAAATSSSATKKRPAKEADSRLVANDTSSQSSFDNFIVSDADISSEFGGTKKTNAKRRKTNASSNAPEKAEVDVALLVASEDDEFAETFANQADASFARWLAQEEAGETNKKGKTLPNSLEMARELGIRYIGGIDPGDVNAAFVVYDAYEAAIVYWRVFKLAEIVRSCEYACGVRLSANSDVKEHRFRLEALMFAIRWWCQQEACPLHRADLVCIESQDFSRRLASIEAAWYTALVGQKNAVDISIKNGTERFVVPKSYSVSADSVKTHFGSTWFPKLSVGARNASSSNKAPRARYKKKAHGMGDANRDSDTERAQYKLNKQRAAEWCVFLAKGKHAIDDLEERAVRRGKWMSSAQLDDTIERLGGKKADDLADALFIALYAADAVIPSLWKRALGPNAKRYKDCGYVVNQPPPQMSDGRRRKMRSGTEDEARRIAEAHHQSLFVYAKDTARIGEMKLDEMRSTLNR